MKWNKISIETLAPRSIYRGFRCEWHNRGSFHQLTGSFFNVVQFWGRECPPDPSLICPTMSIGSSVVAKVSERSVCVRVPFPPRNLIQSRVSGLWPIHTLSITYVMVIVLLLFLCVRRHFTSDMDSLPRAVSDGLAVWWWLCPSGFENDPQYYDTYVLLANDHLPVADRIQCYFMPSIGHWLSFRCSFFKSGMNSDHKIPLSFLCGLVGVVQLIHREIDVSAFVF